MLDELRRALEAEPDLVYALVFGSTARGHGRPASDVDVAVEPRPGAPRDLGALGRLSSRLESAAQASIDLVLIDEAPAPVAYRVFRDGQVLLERDHTALVARKARAIVAYLDFQPVETRCAEGVLRAAARGDKALLADRIAVVRDATARIRDVLPPSAEAFVADRTSREVVVLNLFVAIQACLDLAFRWLADEGWAVPGTCGEIFTALADHEVLDRGLASRRAGAAGLPNLVAHQYGVLDWRRVHGATSSDLGDLEALCAALAARVS